MDRRRRGGGSEVVQQGKGILKLDFLQEYRADEVELLDLSDNKIQRTAGLSHLTALTALDLSHNFIARIDGLERLLRLQELRLHSNNIGRVQNLEGLRRLTTLDLNNNKIETMEGLAGIRGLTDLNLASNSIADIGDIGGLSSLRALNLRGNLIKVLKTTPLFLPRSLRLLNLADNMVANLAEMQHLSQLSGLQHILLSGNVFGHTAKACGFTYRPLVIALLPSVESVDDQLVGDERAHAVELFARSGSANRRLLNEVRAVARPNALRASQCPAIRAAHTPLFLMQRTRGTHFTPRHARTGGWRLRACPFAAAGQRGCLAAVPGIHLPDQPRPGRQQHGRRGRPRWWWRIGWPWQPYNGGVQHAAAAGQGHAAVLQSLCQDRGPQAGPGGAADPSRLQRAHAPPVHETSPAEGSRRLWEQGELRPAGWWARPGACC